MDLSPSMASLARARSLYASVEAGELAAFLAARPAACADLVVAADVFVYVGDLAEVFARTSRVLAEGGRFAFTVEGGGPGDGFALRPTQRYAHDDGYVRGLASGRGLDVVHSSAETIRAERGEPVGGRLFVLERKLPRPS